MKDYEYNFSDTVKRLRKEQGISQTELSERLGIANMTISKWERNKEALPSCKILFKLADYFHVSLDELVGRERL